LNRKTILFRTAVTIFLIRDQRTFGRPVGRRPGQSGQWGRARIGVAPACLVCKTGDRSQFINPGNGGISVSGLPRRAGRFTNGPPKNLLEIL
jgi:hypothetical protein